MPRSGSSPITISGSRGAAWALSSVDGIVKGEHVTILRQGADVWNDWRHRKQEATPWLAEADLRGLDLTGVNLHGANLHSARMDGVDLTGAQLDWAELGRASLVGAQLNGAFLVSIHAPQTDLTDASLVGAVLSEATLHGGTMIRADLSEADLLEARLAGANLTNATLRRTRLHGASLFRANLTGADLTEANLTKAHLVETTIEGTTFDRALVYGIAAWNLEGSTSAQRDLVITRQGEPALTVDDLEVAQFLYLMLHNEKLNRVLDTITSKVVLILGRFTDARKRVLDQLRSDLRARNYTPVLFDFDMPSSRDATGTVEILARLARFVVADLTDPSSVPHELATVAPSLRTTPVVLIRLAGSAGYSMVKDLAAYPWVLPLYEYPDVATLVRNIDIHVIAPAEERLSNL